MKQFVSLVTVLSFLLIIPGSNLIGVPKGHVPVGKVQVCHDGDPVETITVSENALDAHLRHGDCQLPACDFNNVFHTGESCTIEGATDGRCALANARDDAGGQTPGCPAGRF